MILTFKFNPHATSEDIEAFKSTLSKLEVKFQGENAPMTLKSLAVPIINARVAQHVAEKFKFIEALYIERYAGDTEPLLKVF